MTRNECGVMIKPATVILAILLLLGAFALRVAATARFVGVASPPDREAGGLDVIDYEEFGWSLAEGRGYVLSDGQPTARRAPGTSLTIAVPYLLFGRDYLAAHLWFCFLSALTCVVTFAVAAMCVRPPFAVMAGIGLAIYPGHVYASMHFFSEVPYALAVILGTLFATLSLTHPRGMWGILGGIAWGMAILCRPNIVIVFPLLAISTLLIAKDIRRKAALALALQLAVAGAVVAPWLIRNHQVFGKPAIATLVGGYTFWGANNTYVLENADLRGDWYFGEHIVDDEHQLVGTEVEREQLAWKYGWDFVGSHIEQMPSLTLWKLYRLVSPFKTTSNRIVYWAFACSWILLAPWFVVGMIHGLRRSFPLALAVQSSWWATVVMAIVFYGNIRFRDGVIPVIMVVGVWGVQAFVDRFQRGSVTSPQSSIESNEELTTS